MDAHRVSSAAQNYFAPHSTNEPIAGQEGRGWGESLYQTAKGLGENYDALCGGQKQYCLPPKVEALVAKPLTLLGKAEDVMFGVRDVLRAHERDQAEGTHGEHTLRATFKSVAKIGTTSLIWTAGAAVAATVSLPVAIGVSGVAFAASLIVPEQVAGAVGWLLGER